MSIKKQEFYEGAALHAVVRGGHINRIHCESPFFILNDQLAILLKYCTKVRSPWGFTFTPDEQRLLQKRAAESDVAIGLICGSDGIAALTYEAYVSIASPRATAVHIGCYRRPGEHYQASGPDGTLKRKIAPSNWQRVLDG
jgi:hypothetical protein